MTTPKHLIRGYHSFFQNYFHDNPALYQQLKAGQHPKSMIISCSDSRIDPAIVLGADAGDVFVVRNVANIVPGYSAGQIDSVGSAAEYACKVLKIKHIIVIGHSQCGGIKAIVEGSAKDSVCIQDWIDQSPDLLTLAQQRLVSGKANDIQQAGEHANILSSLHNLRGYPWIKQTEDQGTLELHGWYFDISSGSLTRYNANTDDFQSLH